jgi:hypothetical protein
MAPDTAAVFTDADLATILLGVPYPPVTYRVPLHNRYSDTPTHALVDGVDFVRVALRSWYVNAQGYPTCGVRNGRGSKTLSLQRFIMNPPEGMVVDHINRNKLDNRRENLRVVTYQESAFNRGVKKNKVDSPLKGIRAARNQWEARITVGGVLLSVGFFATATEAARGYDAASRFYHRGHAPLNFPRPGEFGFDGSRR